MFCCIKSFIYKNSLFEGMTLDDVTEGVFQEKGDLAQAFEHFDKNIRNDDGSTSVDQNSNLMPDDIPLMTSIDVLERMGIFPAGLGLTNQMKLLKKSLGGWHIHQKVAIAQGERDKQSGAGIWNKIGGMFKPMG